MNSELRVMIVPHKAAATVRRYRMVATFTLALSSLIASGLGRAQTVSCSGGPNDVTCNGTAFPNGISFQVATPDVLDVTLQPGTNVVATNVPGVFLQNLVGEARLTATDATIDTTNPTFQGIHLRSPAGVTVTLNNISMTTTGNPGISVLAEAINGGAATINMNGGVVVNNRTGPNDHGLDAQAFGAGTVTVNFNAGSVTTFGGIGAVAWDAGFGSGPITLTSGPGTIVNALGTTFNSNGLAALDVGGAGTSATLHSQSIITATNFGLDAQSTPGVPVTVTQQGGSIAAGNVGINVAAGGTAMVTNSGAITTSNDGSTGIRVISGGAASVINTGSVVVTGSDATGVLTQGPASTVDSFGLISSPAFAVRFVSGTNDLFLRSGSTTVGTVQMGSGSDHTTVFGGANITGVPKFDGGLGSSILTFDGYSAPVNAIDPWIEVQVLNGSNVVFSGADVHIANLFRIDGTSALAFSTQTGTLTGDVVNAGLLDYSVGNGAAAYDITGTLMNSGTVTLAGVSGVPGNTLTVGNLVGSGGTFAFNSFLGADGSPSDKLVINGGTASGDSLLKITNAGGPGDLTVANGILVVDAINGGTTAPGTFALAGPVVAGPFEYTLFRGGVGAPESWFLRSTLIPGPDEPPCPLPTPEGPPPPGVTPPVIPPGQAPNFRPEVSLNAALPNLTLLYGRSIVGTLHERVGDEVGLAVPAPVVTSTAIGDGSGARPRTTPFAEPDPAQAANGAWGRIIAEHGDRDGGCPVLVGPSFDYGFAAVQAGFDAVRLEHASGARDRAGVYGVFGSVHADVQSQTGAAAGRDRFGAYSVGGYWTHYGAWDWYLDGVVQSTFYDVRDESTRLAALETNGWGFVASLEAGIPFRGLLGGWGLLGGVTVEPQAQLVYQTIDLGDSEDIGARVRFEDVDSLAGRLGVRFATKWAMPGFWGLPATLGTAWFRPSWWHEFDDDARTLFSSAIGFLPFRSNIAEDWVELNSGFTVQVDRTTALFASSNYDIATDGDGEAWEGKIGLKVAW